MANISFDASVTADEAAFLISQAEALTYRQYQLLWIFGNKSQGNYNLRRVPYDLTKPLGASRVAVLQEVFDLYTRGMVSGDSAWFGAGSVTPDRVVVHGIGGRLYTLLGLGGPRSIFGPELIPVIGLLQ